MSYIPPFFKSLNAQLSDNRASKKSIHASATLFTNSCDKKEMFKITKILQTFNINA